MKKVMFPLMMVLILTASFAQARTLDEIKKSGVIKIAADGATPPFNYFKGDQLVGFEVDLANEIAKRLGVKAEWVVQPFNTLLVAIKDDRFDLIATSHAKTNARAAVVDFIEPHYCTGNTFCRAYARNAPPCADTLCLLCSSGDSPLFEIQRICRGDDRACAQCRLI